MLKQLMQYRGRLAVGLAVFALGAVQASAQDLYWTEEPVIMASDIDGENVTEVFDGTGMGGYAVDIVVTDEYLYWTDHAGSGTEGGIWRAERDGGNAELFVENDGSFSAPHYLVISEVHGKIYFSCYSNGLLQADLDTGGNVEVLFDDFAQAFTGLALRGENDEELIWISAGSDAIYRTQLPSGNTPQDNVILEVAGMAGGTYGVAYEPDEDALYFTHFTNGRLNRFDFDTEETTILAAGLTEPLGLKFSPSRTHLLIAERGNGVSAYQLDNSGYGLLVDSSDAHFGVAVTADPGELDPPPMPDPGEILFHTDFEEDGQELDEPPLTIEDGGVWAGFDGPGEGIAHVVEDTEAAFGRETDNRFLRLETVNSLNFVAEFDPVDVVTVSWDYIGRVNPDDGNRWLNASIQAGGERAHITSPRPWTQVVRGNGDPSYGLNDVPVRMDTIVNNSGETITYDRPDGGTAELAPRMASLWLYHYSTGSWDQLQEEYVYVRELGEGDIGAFIDNLEFQFDSGVPRSMDLDNIYVFYGAVPGEQFMEADAPPPPFGGFVDADFNGIPTGEITSENFENFIHGNLSNISFHRRYDEFDPETDEDGFEPTPLLVAEDAEDLFGQGTDNQILDTNGARGWRLIANNNFNQEVMTFRMDLVGRQISGGRMTGRFFDQFGGATHRVEIFSTGSSNGHFDPEGEWEYDSVQRFEWVLNNSDEEITYTRPDGGEKILIPGGGDMWVNGVLRFSDSTLGRDTDSYGPIMDLRFEAFSTNTIDADINLVQTLPGVQLEDVEAPAPRYTLELAWELGPGDRDYLTDDSRQRGLAYNPVTGHLIVPDREETIGVIDASDGAHVGTLSTEGISGGIFELNHVAAADDGAIYGANLTRDAGGTQDGPLKVYRWENEQADPVLVYEGDPSRGDQEEYEDRFGDTMAVRGSGLETQILMAPRFGKNVTILTPDGSMDAFVDNLIVTDIPTSPAGWLTHGLAFGEGDTFFGTRQPQFGSTTSQRGLVEVEFDLDEGTGSVVRILEPTVFRNDVGPIGLDLERQLLVGIDSYAHEEMAARQPQVLLYDLAELTDETFNFPMGVESFGPGNLNGNGSGQVVFGDNGVAYVFDTNNGVAAYNLVEPVDALTFASWMDELPEEDRPPEGQRGPLDEPVGDGISNLIKYALGLSPMVPGTRDLPVREVQSLEVDGEEADYLTLTFTRPNAVSDVEYAVEAGGDPGDWPDSAVPVDGLTTDNGDGTTTYTYRDLQPIEDSDRRFLRLSVEWSE